MILPLKAFTCQIQIVVLTMVLVILVSDVVVSQQYSYILIK